MAAPLDITNPWFKIRQWSQAWVPTIGRLPIRDAALQDSTDPFADYAARLPNEASQQALADMQEGKLNRYDSLAALRERFPKR
jgi:hypothetical protein